MYYQFTGAIICARKNVRLRRLYTFNGGGGVRFKSMNFKCLPVAGAVHAALNVINRRKGVHEVRGASCFPQQETSDKPLSVHFECKFVLFYRSNIDAYIRTYIRNHKQCVEPGMLL
jgi:hypothetical protein